MPDVFGEHLTLEELGKLAGQHPTTVHLRLKRGQSVGQILATPVRQRSTFIGERFGRLRVLTELEERTAAGKRRYRCECDCGDTKEVIGADLKSGRTTSCGCAKKEATRAARVRGAEDLTNKTFADGWITVLGPGKFVLVSKGSGERRRIREWRCKCKCGTPFETKAAQLRAGQTTSCGCRKKALTVARAKAGAPRHNFFGEHLTLAEIAEVTGVEGPTIAYRMRRLEMTAEQAATTGPLRRYAERPKSRRAAAREAA
jgi:hypothetical protein